LGNVKDKIQENSMNKKPWYRGASASLIITFFLGVGVGFGLCYAGLELMREGVQQETAGVAPIPAPESYQEPVPDSPQVKEPEKVTVAEPVAEPVVIETPEPIAPSVDPETVWPVRHLILGLEGTTLNEDTRSLIQNYLPGGIWIREANVRDAEQLEALIQSIYDLFIGTDINTLRPLIYFAPESGLAQNPLQLDAPKTYSDIGALENMDAVKQSGRITAETAVKIGIDVLLSPPLDVYSPEASSADDTSRYFGDTTEKVTQVGLAYGEGIMEAGMIAVAKHYPGEGTTIMQPDGIKLLADTDINALVSVMMPFAEAATIDIQGLLVGAITVPALDVNVPGRPAFVSPILVKEALRNKWGYQGVIIADDILLAEGWSLSTIEEDIVAALVAGCDAVMVSSVSEEDINHYIRTVLNSVESGKLDRDTLTLGQKKMDLWRQQVERTR